jgi:hypothetical protein
MKVNACRLNGIGQWNGCPSLCGQPYENLKSYDGDAHKCRGEANKDEDAHY